MKTINLFEFGDAKKIFEKEKDLTEFNDFLNAIWQNRKEATLNYDENIWEFDENEKEQQFLKINFLKEIRANNYVGVIRFGETAINILPKIFKQKEPLTETDLQGIHAHLLWWLSHCSKIKFPKSWSNFNHIKSDFFEILIYLFANYTKETLSKILYQTYQEVEKELPYMKGRLDMNRYIQQNLSKGQWHQLSCIYSAFELDNRFNRIIKYVAKLLISVTQNVETKQLLSDIVFMLDEVGDYRMTASDCEKVHINPLYQELKPILDYCRLFLTNSTVLRFKNELEVFAFLLPMEVIFEDFLVGFLQKHFSDNLEIETQKSDKYLASLFYDEQKVKEKVFQLRHDIFIKKGEKRIIIDTKYKAIYTNPNSQNKKHGVSQSDMYQMVSYAIRRNCQDVKLIYPNRVLSGLNDKDIQFMVDDELANKQINIGIYEIPFIQKEFEFKPYQSLEEHFKPLEKELIEKLNRIL